MTAKRYIARCTDWVLVSEDKKEVSEALFRVAIDSYGDGEFISITSPDASQGRIEVDPNEIDPVIDLIRAAQANMIRDTPKRGRDQQPVPPGDE